MAQSFEPPYSGGVMTLTDSERAGIRSKLQAIMSREPQTDERGAPIGWDIFWTVAAYNRENPEAPINGDTAEHILGQEG